eukprot:1183843-Prorocentrum_minimum.AAC.2
MCAAAGSRAHYTHTHASSPHRMWAAAQAPVRTPATSLAPCCSASLHVSRLPLLAPLVPAPCSTACVQTQAPCAHPCHSLSPRPRTASVPAAAHALALLYARTLARARQHSMSVQAQAPTRTAPVASSAHSSWHRMWAAAQAPARTPTSSPPYPYAASAGSQPRAPLSPRTRNACVHPQAPTRTPTSSAHSHVHSHVQSTLTDSHVHSHIHSHVHSHVHSHGTHMFTH